MSIGERIIELRKERNVSQVDLSKQLSVSRQAVSKWENDQATPDTLKLIRLAEVLDTDVEYLATGVHTTRTSPPQIITVEKVVEIPVETVVEKPVYIEKTVEVEKILERVVEKPMVHKVYRTRYLRSPIEYAIVGISGLIIGFLIGFLFLNMK